VLFEAWRFICPSHSLLLFNSLNANQRVSPFGRRSLSEKQIQKSLMLSHEAFLLV